MNDIPSLAAVLTDCTRKFPLGCKSVLQIQASVPLPPQTRVIFNKAFISDHSNSEICALEDAGVEVQKALCPNVSAGLISREILMLLNSLHSIFIVIICAGNQSPLAFTEALQRYPWNFKNTFLVIPELNLLDFSSLKASLFFQAKIIVSKILNSHSNPSPSFAHRKSPPIMFPSSLLQLKKNNAFKKKFSCRSKAELLTLVKNALTKLILEGCQTPILSVIKHTIMSEAPLFKENEYGFTRFIDALKYCEDQGIVFINFNPVHGYAASLAPNSCIEDKILPALNAADLSTSSRFSLLKQDIKTELERIQSTGQVSVQVQDLQNVVYDQKYAQDQICSQGDFVKILRACDFISMYSIPGQGWFVELNTKMLRKNVNPQAMAENSRQSSNNLFKEQAEILVRNFNATAKPCGLSLNPAVNCMIFHEVYNFLRFATHEANQSLLPTYVSFLTIQRHVLSSLQDFNPHHRINDTRDDFNSIEFRNDKMHVSNSLARKVIGTALKFGALNFRVNAPLKKHSTCWKPASFEFSEINFEEASCRDQLWCYSLMENIDTPGKFKNVIREGIERHLEQFFSEGYPREVVGYIVSPGDQPRNLNFHSPFPVHLIPDPTTAMT